MLHISLEELNVIPGEVTDQKLLSKGFFNSISVQDFPIHGQGVFPRSNEAGGSIRIPEQ